MAHAQPFANCVGERLCVRHRATVLDAMKKKLFEKKLKISLFLTLFSKSFEKKRPKSGQMAVSDWMWGICPTSNFWKKAGFFWKKSALFQKNLKKSRKRSLRPPTQGHMTFFWKIFEFFFERWNPPRVFFQGGNCAVPWLGLLGKLKSGINRPERVDFWFWFLFWAALSGAIRKFEALAGSPQGRGRGPVAVFHASETLSGFASEISEKSIFLKFR